MSRTLKGFFLSASALALLVGGWVVFDFFIWVPDFSKLKESVPVPVRLANGNESTRQVGPRAPGWTSLSAMAEFVPRAVVSSEDASFYSHKGIDVFEMQEAFKKDLKEGRFARGASTITQQVLKNVYLMHYPRVWRKLKEVAWASKLEAALTKPQILAFYLNMAEWGPGIYGVGEASRHYFGVAPASLTARQSAFLAMLLPSPKRYHAYFKKRALTQWAAQRVNRILAVMNKMGHLSPEAYEVALNEQLWGVEVLSDAAPGAPPDPGWDAGESESEQFEPAAGESASRPAVVPAAPTSAGEIATAPADKNDTVVQEKPPEEEPLEDSEGDEDDALSE